MRPNASSIVISLGLASSLSLNALADTTSGLPILLEKALVARPLPQVYAYDFEMKTNGKDASTIRGSIDPSKPEGQRVEITSVEGGKTSAAEIDERMEKNSDGDIWCDNIIGGADGPVKNISETPDKHQFQFIPLANAEADSDTRKMYKRLVANLEIDPVTESIVAMSARLTAPWKPNVVAKISAFKLSAICETAPNGRRYTARMTTQIKGSALGNTFDQEMVRRISSLKAVK